MSENETFGIDTIKTVLKSAFKVITNIEKAKESDDKVSFMEASGIVIGAVPDAYNAIKNGKTLYNELKDLDESERAELNTWFATEFDLADDEAEEKVEAIFEWILATADAIEVIVG